MGSACQVYGSHLNVSFVPLDTETIYSPMVASSDTSSGNYL